MSFDSFKEGFTANKVCYMPKRKLLLLFFFFLLLISLYAIRSTIYVSNSTKISLLVPEGIYERKAQLEDELKEIMSAGILPHDVELDNRESRHSTHLELVEFFKP